MDGIDRERFGPFVARLRKEKGLTQKALAQRIHVSDKAVSKWERAAGLPDITLLIPLAEALDVTVTELLRGCREPAQTAVSADEAEALVRRVLAMSGKEPARGGPDRKKWGIRYALCLIPAAVSMWRLMTGMIRDPDHWLTYQPAALMTALAAVFGLYFCLFARTRLPWYYDADDIGFYQDGPMRINMPGVRFNNRTWPHILTGLRLWSLLTMALSGAVCALAKGLFGPGLVAAYLPMGSLAGLLAAVYVPGRKK